MFKIHFEIDHKLETAKKQCTRLPSFSVDHAFTTIDTNLRGTLNKEDLKKFMQKNGFSPTESELVWLCARFDKNLNGVIRYQEFIDEIVPSKVLLGEMFTKTI